MRIDVVGRNMEITDAIRQHAESKANKLLKVFDGTQLITVVLERNKHSQFHAEIMVDVVKHEDFVAKCSHEDLYASIDLVVDKAQRQLRDFKEKLRLH